jgi:predicted component of type VI protein secretion system
MPTLLVALAGGPDILVNADLVVVGRDPGCDARLDSPQISRMHCCLIEIGGGVLVRDLGSTNGVRINGRQSRSGRLRPGDELSVAHLRYRVEGGQSGSSRCGSPWSPGTWTPSPRGPSSPQKAPPILGEWSPPWR